MRQVCTVFSTGAAVAAELEYMYSSFLDNLQAQISGISERSRDGLTGVIMVRET